MPSAEHTAVVFLLSALVAAGCGSADKRPPVARAGAGSADEPQCAGRSTRVLLWQRATPMGCARTPAGTAINLYWIRELGGPCLIITGLPGGPRACGRVPSERVPPTRAAIGGPVIVRRSPAAKLEVYGETGPNVTRVVLRYRLPGGRPSIRSATLIGVRDEVTLRRARVREPFGYFIGAVPPRAMRVAAMALDESGEVLGRLSFDEIERSLHPTVFIAAER